jgi:hypothetical protein
MGRITSFITVVLLSAALPLVARPQQQESLGDVARQLREQHDKDAKKATAVFTNDNLPAPKPGEAVSVTAAPAEPPAKDEPATDKPAAPKPDKAGNHESPEDKTKTRDYWQGKFKAARQDVAKAKEQQQLSEDELNLLQIQQIRELDPMAKSDLAAKVQAKQSDVDLNASATQAAQKNLDDLEQEFKDSGAPEEWSQTD